MKTGFTLIELLVVVLIIAILAAIALPKYNRLVFRNRMLETEMNIAAIDKAIQVLMLELGAKSRSEIASANYEAMTLSLPGCGTRYDASNFFIECPRETYMITSYAITAAMYWVPGQPHFRKMYPSGTYECHTWGSAELERVRDFCLTQGHVVGS